MSVLWALVLEALLVLEVLLVLVLPLMLVVMLLLYLLVNLSEFGRVKLSLFQLGVSGESCWLLWVMSLSPVLAFLVLAWLDPLDHVPSLRDLVPSHHDHVPSHLVPSHRDHASPHHDHAILCLMPLWPFHVLLSRHQTTLVGGHPLLQAQVAHC